MEKLGISVFLCTSFFGGAASDPIFMNKNLDAGRWFYVVHTGAQRLCEIFCFGGIRLSYTGMRLLFSRRTEWPAPSGKTNPNSVLAAQTRWTHLKRHHRGVCVRVCPELIPSEGSIVVVAGMRIAGDSFSPVLGLTPLSISCVANGLLLQ